MVFLIIIEELQNNKCGTEQTIEQQLAYLLFSWSSLLTILRQISLKVKEDFLRK
jgi:hypothetical protein